MKFSIKASILIFVIFISNLAIAKNTPQSYNSKLGTNALSAIILGDINGFFEKKISKRVSFVSTAHYITSKTFKELETDFRGTIGLRSYGFKSHYDNPYKNIFKNTSLIGAFFEFKTGLIRIDGKLKNSIEFGGGKTYLFNENLYYEWKLGLSRIFGETSEIESPVTLTGAFGIGFLI